MKRWVLAAVAAATISAAIPSTPASGTTVCCSAGTKGTSVITQRKLPYGTTAGSKGNAGNPGLWFWLP